MNLIHVSRDDGIVTITLNRDKVNAFSEPMIEKLRGCFEDLENDRDVQAIILTGQGKFFSFGFDIPGFLSYSKDAFIGYLTKFTELYRYVFLFPKPVIAALNGHAIAGGCMLALACDYRIMVSGKAKISLNEIAFGSSVFAGCVEMLKFHVGAKNAESVLYSGAMFSAEEANRMRFVDQVSSQENLSDDARKIARDFTKKDSVAFNSIKGLLRRPVAEEMIKREPDSVREFADIWYSESTWKKLQEIKIHP